MELKSTTIVPDCFLIVSQTLNMGALPARVPSHSPGVHFASAYISKEAFPQGEELIFEGFNLLQRFNLQGAGCGWGAVKPFENLLKTLAFSPYT